MQCSGCHTSDNMEGKDEDNAWILYITFVTKAITCEKQNEFTKYLYNKLGTLSI